MKKLLLLITLMFTVSCTESTKHGECIGFDDEKDETLVYEISVSNAIIAAIFVETIIVPIVWGLDVAYCPVGEK